MTNYFCLSRLLNPIAALEKPMENINRAVLKQTFSNPRVCVQLLNNQVSEWLRLKKLKSEHCQRSARKLLQTLSIGEN